MSFRSGLAFLFYASLELQALGDFHTRCTQPTCSDLTLPAFENFAVVSSEAHAVYNNSLAPGVDFCNLTVILNDPDSNDAVIAEIWLPLAIWNGRFLATGGGGLASGYESSMAAYVGLGYATGFTDAGLTKLNTIDPQSGSWALNPDGSLNWALIQNFAYRSLHEMTVVGKAAIQEFYGQAAEYSYYVGCSTGGRMGYSAAQNFPGDYDGILAESPAINTPQVSPADFWPTVVMYNIAAPPQCVFDSFLEQIIADCDALDGVTDGLISRPERCDFDVKKLVGKTVSCSDTGGNVQISAEHADAVSRIIEGARTTDGQFLWFGLPLGAPFSGLANTSFIDGTVIPLPFSSAEAWIEYFVLQNTSFDSSDPATLSFAQFDGIFNKSVERYTAVLGTDEPDLAPFNEAGGKFLTWHGMADPLIAHNGTTLYWDRVQRDFNNQSVVDSFYRVFLAPGGGHCSGGYGPIPTDPLSALTAWVEGGEAPDVLFAEILVDNVNITRNLCPYPKVLTYVGSGDVNDAASFTCTND